MTAWIREPRVGLPNEETCCRLEDFDGLLEPGHLRCSSRFPRPSAAA